jgi:rRNA-processing protein FCF1
MIQVIADTNALLLPFKNKINVEAELDRLLGRHEILIPVPILNELKGLEVKFKYAKAALKWAQTKSIMPTESFGDNSVLELAESVKGIVLSNDKLLIKRAKAKSLKVIRMREGNHLAFENYW